MYYNNYRRPTSYTKRFMDLVEDNKHDIKCDTCLHKEVCMFSNHYEELEDEINSCEFLEKETINCKYYISNKED